MTAGLVRVVHVAGPEDCCQRCGSRIAGHLLGYRIGSPIVVTHRADGTPASVIGLHDMPVPEELMACRPAASE